MSDSSIQIVNDQDGLIGHKLRSEVDYAHDIYRSTAVWITSTAGNVLIAQRKLTKDKDPGKWGPAAAGTVDEGETYESNARKEAEEELGIKIDSLQSVSKLFIQSPRRQFMQIYRANIAESQPLTPQEDEVERVAWVDGHYLRNDVARNPDKYVSSMPLLLETIR